MATHHSLVGTDATYALILVPAAWRSRTFFVLRDNMNDHAKLQSAIIQLAIAHPHIRFSEKSAGTESLALPDAQTAVLAIMGSSISSVHTVDIRLGIGFRLQGCLQSPQHAANNTSSQHLSFNGRLCVDSIMHELMLNVFKAVRKVMLADQNRNTQPARANKAQRHSIAPNEVKPNTHPGSREKSTRRGSSFEHAAFVLRVTMPIEDEPQFIGPVLESYAMLRPDSLALCMLACAIQQAWGLLLPSSVAIEIERLSSRTAQYHDQSSLTDLTGKTDSEVPNITLPSRTSCAELQAETLCGNAPRASLMEARVVASAAPAHKRAGYALAQARALLMSESKENNPKRSTPDPLLLS